VHGKETDMKINGKVFVVTGGGSGIGRALVLALLAGGAKGVAAVDINEAALEETRALAGERSSAVSLHVVNVADRPRVEALVGQVLAAHGAVDGLVNNAGIIQPFVKLAELDYAAIERVMNVNFYGQVYMLKSFLPELLKRPEAHIVNVSSMGGFFPFPGQTLYGASKAAVKLLTEGLYAELLGSPVGVSAVFPGAINTNITANSGVTMAAPGGVDASKFPTTSAEKAAQVIITAIERKQFQAYIGNDAKLMNILYKLNPRGATGMIRKQMQGLLGG
jgi:NAD(P)-dependent dehydrogenase (short-subunit alcohol dehydrogenase family)